MIIPRRHGSAGASRGRANVYLTVTWFGEIIDNTMLSWYICIWIFGVFRRDLADMIWFDAKHVCGSPSYYVYPEETLLETPDGGKYVFAPMSVTVFEF